MNSNQNEIIKPKNTLSIEKIVDICRIVTTIGTIMYVIAIYIDLNKELKSTLKLLTPEPLSTIIGNNDTSIVIGIVITLVSLLGLIFSNNLIPDKKGYKSKGYFLASTITLLILTVISMLVFAI